MRTPLVLGLALAATAGHVMYPLALGAAARNRTLPQPPEPSPWPAVTAVVPAYREAGVIGAKVRDILANGYPGELEVLVVADGDPDTAAAAAEAGARVLAPPERLGKAQGLNAGVRAASHEMLVFSDANNHLVPGSISALVRWLCQPGVGAVAGEKVEADEGGETTYWRFESWLKQREAALGTTIGLVGELAGVRRSAWRAIPEDIASDDLWLALDMAEQGLRVPYEPEARSVEASSGSLRTTWERRIRILSGSLHVFSRRRSQLRPTNLLALEVWGHKLWRSTGGPLAHVALILVALSRARQSRLAQLFLLGHVGGAASFVPAARRRPMPLPITVAGQVLFLQAVALGGMWRYLRGDRSTKWTTVAR